ncbi:MAG: RidA family protein [Planctomycetota bacterium]|jgi:enamine deaminase RidA (YjgF/YER057c/UK114 family)
MRTIMILVLLFLASACSNMGAGRVEVLNLPGRSDDLPFNHIVVAGHTVYVAGTIGVDPATGLAPADPEQEARLALDGVKAKLALADLTMDDLVSIQVFCSDLSLYGTFNAVYRTYFERDFPVRAFIGSGPLLRNGRFEISGIAVIP